MVEAGAETVLADEIVGLPVGDVNQQILLVQNFQKAVFLQLPQVGFLGAGDQQPDIELSAKPSSSASIPRS